VLTIDTIVTCVLAQNAARHQAMPVRQRCIEALNDVLQAAMPEGPDRIAEGHDLAEQLDDIVLAANTALEAQPINQPKKGN
jgi:antitoxin component of RelBE/YafQ-DinJ toxin-antitoxin module